MNGSNKIPDEFLPVPEPKAVPNIVKAAEKGLAKPLPKGKKRRTDEVYGVPEKFWKKFDFGR